uniref:Uncharacterized protein n=1 Tax=Cucumis melo TaxID=3656 RepID=A0A9I9EKG2_CUCME
MPKEDINGVLLPTYRRDIRDHRSLPRCRFQSSLTHDSIGSPLTCCSDGKFTVKSAYHLTLNLSESKMVSSSNPHLLKDRWKALWKARNAKKYYSIKIGGDFEAFMWSCRGESRTLVGLDLDKFKDEEIDMIILMRW